MPGIPPIAPPQKSDKDWSPFGSRAGFELADLLFKKIGLSQNDINHLLSLWSATLTPYGDTLPIADHCDLHVQIDGVELGSVPWKLWTVQYQGH